MTTEEVKELFQKRKRDAKWAQAIKSLLTSNPPDPQHSLRYQVGRILAFGITPFKKAGISGWVRGSPPIAAAALGHIGPGGYQGTGTDGYSTVDIELEAFAVLGVNPPKPQWYDGVKNRPTLRLEICTKIHITRGARGPLPFSYQLHPSMRPKVDVVDGAPGEFQTCNWVLAFGELRWDEDADGWLELHPTSTLVMTEDEVKPFKNAARSVGL